MSTTINLPNAKVIKIGGITHASYLQFITASYGDKTIRFVGEGENVAMRTFDLKEEVVDISDAAGQTIKLDFSYSIVSAGHPSKPQPSRVQGTVTASSPDQTVLITTSEDSTDDDDNDSICFIVVRMN
ncbi:hypothetical protein MRB53_036868 [Persea americana]|nr:hypothetical protein MRB53_036868 [Persea americana]